MFASAAFLISAIRHRPGRPCQRAPVERENHQRQKDQMPHQLIKLYKGLKRSQNTFYIIEKITLVIPKEKHGLQTPSLFKCLLDKISLLWKTDSSPPTICSPWITLEGIYNRFHRPLWTTQAPRGRANDSVLSIPGCHPPTSNGKKQWKSQYHRTVYLQIYIYIYHIYSHIGMYACIFTCKYHIHHVTVMSHVVSFDEWA